MLSLTPIVYKFKLFLISIPYANFFLFLYTTFLGFHLVSIPLQNFLVSFIWTQARRKKSPQAIFGVLLNICEMFLTSFCVTDFFAILIYHYFWLKCNFWVKQQFYKKRKRFLQSSLISLRNQYLGTCKYLLSYKFWFFIIELVEN